jgi:hypothetical protein
MMDRKAAGFSPQKNQTRKFGCCHFLFQKREIIQMPQGVRHAVDSNPNAQNFFFFES